MNVSIIGGTGYVGLITGLGLAIHGNNVICMDTDLRKIETLNNGELPIYEEGLAELLKEATDRNKIVFTNCLKTAVNKSELIMLAVGTPEGKNGETDLSHLVQALKLVANQIDSYRTIVIKSTAPVGTCEMARTIIKDHLKNRFTPFDVVSNPEFLREGNAVRDFLKPERIVIGVDVYASEVIMKELYQSFDVPIVLTDTRSSEMVKYACNAYLATRISFINEISEISEKVNADVHAILEGMKLDKRIGELYLNPGPGFGGPCLTKDLKSLISFAGKANAELPLLKAVLERNEVQISNIIDYVISELQDVRGKKIAVLGLSFKAGTNDTRNSPAVHLLEKLLEKLLDTKILIHVYDPVVKSIEEPLNSRVVFPKNIEDTLRNADCLIVMTEWPKFKELDLEKIYHLMRTPLIVDTRNIFPYRKVYSLGFRYKGIGIASKRFETIQSTLEKSIV
ncbi:MAG: UDP-glucose/GDP-mannose dehydrogenase family protein [Desulfosporosinus sp.]|nr:UDP-glucose/GDP-mannose dehydrogenase family protein [Desulfosporosinus sp.]